MMMKKLLVLIACAGLTFHVTGCTSNDSKPDAEVTSDFDSADLEKLEGEEALDVASDDSLMGDSLAEDALGESKPTEVTTTTETTTTTSESTPGLDQATTERTDVATNTETLPADPFAESSTSDTMPPEPPSTMASTESTMATSEPESTAMVESTTTTTTESTMSSFESTPAPKANVSLQKTAAAPWQVGKTWFNTVYFARPGDSLSSVSQMIYGSDKVAELKKGNPTYKSRDLKPGDKVYYNSPHRPDDSTRVITYYEDNGVPSETYIAQANDNIRKVSKDLLGYDGAWKEIWSSNTVDSKGALAAGTELRFWRGGAAAPAAQPPIPQELAGANQPPPMDQGQLPPPPMPEMGNEQPPDMGMQAGNDFPPPPPMPEMAPPPPPPDMAQMAPPPPPPPEAMNPVAQAPNQEEPAAGMDSDTTMALAVVGLAAAGLAVLIVMRKKRRQKELEQQAMSDTHVG